METEFRDLNNGRSVTVTSGGVYAHLVSNDPSDNPGAGYVGITMNGETAILDIENAKYLVACAVSALEWITLNRGGTAWDDFVKWGGTELADGIIGRGFLSLAQKSEAEAYAKGLERAEREARALRLGALDDAKREARREVASELRALLEAASAEDETDRAAILADLDIRGIVASLKKTGETEKRADG